MKRIPGEPLFVFTTRESAQFWTLGEYLRYLAVDDTWTVWRPGCPPGNVTVLLPGDTVERNFTYSVVEHAETCTVDGVPLRRCTVKIQAGGFSWSPQVFPEPLVYDTWRPDHRRELPDVTPWRWDADGLKITLRLPGDPS